MRASAFLLALLLIAAAPPPAPPLPAPVVPPGARPPVDRTLQPTPWSGWWWPMLDRPGTATPHLYDAGGPLDKFDRFVAATTGRSPGTRDWEYQHMRVIDPDKSWWGHCNGWAAAAVLEPEPVRAVERGGVRFGVGDQKGLLSAWHQADGAAFAIGGQNRSLTALAFHRALVDFTVRRRMPVIVNVFSVGSDRYQVWNYPTFRVRFAYTPDAADPRRTHVAATVWYVGNQVPPDFVGTQPWPSGAGKTYTYWLLDDPENPSAGEWEGETAGDGELARPSLVWFPDADRRVQGLAPPTLRYESIRAITAGGASPGGAIPAAVGFGGGGP